MKTEKVLGLGALTAGGLASLCCLGPLVFATLGLGAFGAGAFFESIGPLLAVVLAVCGLSGLVLAYRKREVACEDGSCRMESASRGTKALLWVLVGMGTFLYAIPYFL